MPVLALRYQVKSMCEREVGGREGQRGWVRGEKWRCREKDIRGKKSGGSGGERRATQRQPMLKMLGKLCYDVLLEESSTPNKALVEDICRQARHIK